MKKGQVMGIPLVMIFALVIGAIILVWGISTGWNLLNLGGEAQLAKMVTGLNDEVDVFSNYDSGAAKKLDISLPDKIEMVCFYDIDREFDCYWDGNLCPKEFADELKVILSSSENMYIYPLVYEISRFDVEDLEPKEHNPVCVSNKNTAWIEKEDESILISYYE